MNIFFLLISFSLIYCDEYDYGNKLVFENGGNILASGSDITRSMTFQINFNRVFSYIPSVALGIGSLSINDAGSLTRGISLAPTGTTKRGFILEVKALTAAQIMRLKIYWLSAIDGDLLFQDYELTAAQLASINQGGEAAIQIIEPRIVVVSGISQFTSFIIGFVQEVGDHNSLSLREDPETSNTLTLRVSSEGDGLLKTLSYLKICLFYSNVQPAAVLTKGIEFTSNFPHTLQPLVYDLGANYLNDYIYLTGMKQYLIYGTFDFQIGAQDQAPTQITINIGTGQIYPLILLKFLENAATNVKKLFFNIITLKSICAKIYPSCNFGGTVIEVCPGSEQTITGIVRSIQMVPRTVVMFKNDQDTSLSMAIIRENKNCIYPFEYNFVKISYV